MVSSFLVVIAVAGTSRADTEGVQHARFNQQAEELGLTATQAQSLQSRVNSYLKQVGGSQVAVNKIRVDDQGSFILLALPGEKKARDISSSTAAGYNCPYKYFCAYQSVSYDGDVKAWTSCIDQSMPWSGYGSWVNNQTPGTVAQFKSGPDGVTRWRDSGAFSADDSADWTWVWWVKPC
ncbi:hypothetical protein [Streptomyces sp. NPDC058086]|uniref:hypothetical protein n=1 Tax=Streptomyces sp. NPDC058086 TaxID=3346334 RepID=UPI0036E18A97